MRRQLWLVALVLLASFGVASAQGVQSSTLIGQVKSSDGEPLPGASVTVASPALQGVRTTVSDGNGGFIFKALPPGAYTITFELSGMSTVEQKRQVGLGSTENVEATLQIAAVEETVTVTAEAPSILENTQRGENYTTQQIDRLATTRTLQGIAELAPGLTDNTPNAGQVTISGGFAFDNVFLVNGVDVNDNLFGSPNDLFIEDAIDEVQVLTSGISAEYGRFGGGVVNAITKRGGNQFSGSYRLDTTAAKWRDENPLEESRNVTRGVDAQGNETGISKTHMATLGGPIMKDRLWFFGAYRNQPFKEGRLLTVSNTPYTTEQNEYRAEGKLTGTISQNHTLQAAYTKTHIEQMGPSLAGFASDPNTFYQPSRTLPQDLFVASYNGVLSNSLFAEVQVSRKKFAFSNSGGSSFDFVDSPIFTLNYGPAHYYNAPYFAQKDNESRDNRQMAGSLSYFLSTATLGRHDLKVGYENYRSTNTGGNSQSQTDFVIYADYVGGSGTPVLDPNGYYQPIFRTGENIAQHWLATPGAKLDITTQSFYMNDRWQMGSRFSANLGVRYERVRSQATGDIVSADTDTVVPRLGASWDIKGDGKLTLDATYAQYAGKFAETQFGLNTAVGNPAVIYYLYTGPDGVGRSCSACFDPRNYNVVLAGNFPTANVFFADNLQAAKTREFTLGAGTALGSRGFVKAIFTDRKLTQVFDGITTTELGATDVTYQGNFIGTFDNTMYVNTDDLSREYRSLQFQSSFRARDNWNFQAHYTLQLRNHGNTEGENTNQPGVTSLWGDYPEVFYDERHTPFGRLNDYQQHKLRAWTNYDLGLGGAGTLNIGLLWRYDSGLTASNVANNLGFTARQQAGIALYASGPSQLSNDIFYGGRGAVEFDGVHNLDLALNYEVPMFNKKVRPWFKIDVRNVLNDKTLVAYGTNVSQDASTPVDEFGFRTGFLPTSTYGLARNNLDHNIPREFRMSLGFRF